jgi:hypothetical protein
MAVKVLGGEIPGKRAHLVSIALHQWAGEHFGIEVKRQKHINLSCVLTSNLDCSFPRRISLLFGNAP